MIIKKKVWPEYFDKILEGKKNFELRLGDFEVSEGDVLFLEEWDPLKEKYTGRMIEKTVKYLIKTKEVRFWPEEEVEKHGFIIMCFD